MTDYQETIIDLMRHGEPEGGHKFRGSLDDPLSELGWQQMRSSLRKRQPWQRVLTSPLQRCHAFAQELSQQCAIPLEISEDIREISFGDWEGLTSEQVMSDYPGLLDAFWRDPITHTPPSGESVSIFSERVKNAWESVVERYAGEHLMLVCHGGTIRAILIHVLSMPLETLWRFDVPFANVSRIRVTTYKDGSSSSNLVFHQPTLTLE